MLVKGDLIVKAYNHDHKMNYHKLTIDVNCAHITITNENGIVVFKQGTLGGNGGETGGWLNPEHRMLYEGLCVLERIAERIDLPTKVQTPQKHCVLLDDEEFTKFLAWRKETDL